MELNQTYVVQFPYAAAPDDPEQISLIPGELLILIEDAGEGWCLVERLGGDRGRGVAPFSYMKVHEAPSAAAGSAGSAPFAAAVDWGHHGQHAVSNIFETAGQETAPPPPASSGSSSSDPALAKYQKMLNVGLPRGAVEQAMKKDGIDVSRLFGSGGATAAAAPGPAAAAGASGLSDDPAVAKYKRMLNAGVPRGAVEQAMKKDNVDVGLLFGASGSAAATSFAGPAGGSSDAGGEDDLAKYRRMIQLGMAQGAIEQIMRKDGVDVGRLFSKSVSAPPLAANGGKTLAEQLAERKLKSPSASPAAATKSPSNSSAAAPAAASPMDEIQRRAVERQKRLEASGGLFTERRSPSSHAESDGASSDRPASNNKSPVEPHGSSQASSHSSPLSDIQKKALERQKRAEAAASTNSSEPNKREASPTSSPTNRAVQVPQERAAAACGSYKLNVAGEKFGDCVCGWSKAAHQAAPASPLLAPHKLLHHVGSGAGSADESAAPAEEAAARRPAPAEPVEASRESLSEPAPSEPAHRPAPAEPAEPAAAHRPAPSQPEAPSKPDVAALRPAPSEPGVAAHRPAPSEPDAPSKPEVAAHRPAPSEPDAPSKPEVAAHRPAPSEPDAPSKPEVAAHRPAPSEPDAPSKPETAAHRPAPSAPEAAAAHRPAPSEPAPPHRAPPAEPTTSHRPAPSEPDAKPASASALSEEEVRAQKRAERAKKPRPRPPPPPPPPGLLRPPPAPPAPASPPASTSSGNPFGSPSSEATPAFAAEPSFGDDASFRPARAPPAPPSAGGAPAATGLRPPPAPPGA